MKPIIGKSSRSPVRSLAPCMAGCVLAILGALAHAQTDETEPHEHEHEHGHDATHHHGAMHGNHDDTSAPTHAGEHDAHSMPGQLGPYAMSRESSGTAWQPEATPMEGLHGLLGEWMWMVHGFANVVYDKQTGPRGGNKTLAQSMAMLMAQRRAGSGTLGLRAMVSLDPWTMGKAGYPLLTQTGETADGEHLLRDRQHPHDAFMELSASYSLPTNAHGSVFVYAGLPGEPALGPAVFMHRLSGMRNPEAPLTHHWLDATHITFGVITLGATQGPWKLEASSFNGREPDERRWDIEMHRLDSWSARLSFNPTPQWALQVSQGQLDRPESLEPNLRIKRTTASATCHATLGGDPWQTTWAWGRNDKRAPDHTERLPGWLLESTYILRASHTFFGRYERLKNDELFDEGHPLHGAIFQVRKLTVGYIHDFARTGSVKWGIGGLVGIYNLPSALDDAYGAHPRSYMVFLQGRL